MFRVTLIVLIFASCNNERSDKKANDFLLEFIDDAEINFTIKNTPIIIIPMQSCSTCKEKITSFFENQNNEILQNVKIVISGHSSKIGVHFKLSQNL